MGVVVSSGLTSSITMPYGYDIVVRYSSQSGRFRFDGTGTFSAKVLMVGGGAAGNAGGSGVSGAGGSGGTYTYWEEFQFTAGLQYSMQVWDTTFGPGNVVIAINPGSYPNPPYQELYVISPGGGAAGAAGVSGLNNGATGSVGFLSNITGATISYGGGGGSGASIGIGNYGVARIQSGGKGNAFYGGVNNGNGGDAQRYSSNIIDTVDDGDSGTDLTGNGGGGGSTVYARAYAFPNNFGWYNGDGGIGGRGALIVRYAVTYAEPCSFVLID
jgi:hypothetical protein